MSGLYYRCQRHDFMYRRSCPYCDANTANEEMVARSRGPHAVPYAAREADPVPPAAKQPAVFDEILLTISALTQYQIPLDYLEFSLPEELWGDFKDHMRLHQTYRGDGFPFDCDKIKLLGVTVRRRYDNG